MEAVGRYVLVLPGTAWETVGTMDWLDFIASVVRSVAWPAALVLIAWLLRAELKALLGRLETVRHKETEASFARAVEDVSSEVAERDDAERRKEVKRLDEAHAELPSHPHLDAVTEVKRLGGTLADHPEAAILASWALLEGAYRQLAAQRHLPVSSSASVPVLIDALVDAGVIAPEDRSSVAKLRRLRNEVAHSNLPKPSAGSAISYTETVAKLLDRVK